jgi:hypothetical protein
MMKQQQVRRIFSWQDMISYYLVCIDYTDI